MSIRRGNMRVQLNRPPPCALPHALGSERLHPPGPAVEEVRKGEKGCNRCLSLSHSTPSSAVPSSLTTAPPNCPQPAPFSSPLPSLLSSPNLLQPNSRQPLNLKLGAVEAAGCSKTRGSNGIAADRIALAGWGRAMLAAHGEETAGVAAAAGMAAG
ncbi:unnamed protein product [Closterium sp. Naga37s-1]|nr:unnamed protein product [Closterium sp. Naga37s-1]